MKKFSKYYETLAVLITIILLLEYIIYPGLTAPNTFVNLLTVLLSIVVIGLSVLFIDSRLIGKEEVITVEPGETELDYLPKKEVVKKKRNPKQPVGFMSDEPFVKTRKKPKKSEFPMEPHDKTVRASTKPKPKTK
jgi:hypothetical protein